VESRDSSRSSHSSRCRIVAFMPRKPLGNEYWHVRLMRQASTILQSPTPCSAWGMPEMPTDMPVEAHCQEDRGINAKKSHLTLNKEK